MSDSPSTKDSLDVPDGNEQYQILDELMSVVSGKIHPLLSKLENLVASGKIKTTLKEWKLVRNLI